MVQNVAQSSCTQEFLRTMDLHPRRISHQHRVTALFGDHRQTFDVAGGTTLAQLSEQLADLAFKNNGWPVGISVVFDTNLQAHGAARPIGAQFQASSGELR